MKRKKIEKKLNLSKKTVANLELQSMEAIHGGLYTTNSCFYTCDPCDTEDMSCNRCIDIDTMYPTCYPDWCPYF